MLDVFLDALIDSLKTLPFLFAAYFLIEYLEHRASSKMERGLQKLGKFGPIGGALLGVLCFRPAISVSKFLRRTHHHSRHTARRVPFHKR